jgi:hypothetical protein
VQVYPAERHMAVYRVHWLKAKSRRDRWREEKILLQSEMQWTELFFRHQASRWRTLAAAISSRDTNEAHNPSQIEFQHSKGHICYALKLESMWNRLAQQAAVQFATARVGIRHSARLSTRSRSSSSSSYEPTPL